MTMCQMDMTYLPAQIRLKKNSSVHDANGQSLIILPRTLLPADGLVGTSCGEALMPGARPGLISSGVRLGCARVAGSDCVGPCSVVIAGMHPGRADGPLKTSERLLATAALKRPNRVD